MIVNYHLAETVFIRTLFLQCTGKTEQLLEPMLQN